MRLSERDSALGALEGLLDTVRADGTGQLVLVRGEAGAGKTVLLRAFAESLLPDVPVLWGSCDNLRTPRPLGPLVDIANEYPGPLHDALRHGAPRTDILNASLDLLHAGRPMIVVVEDAHWADEATLDVLAFVARRIHRTQALLVLTYRSEEVGPAHPLTAVLGELATVRPARIPVLPLSAEAVAELASGHAIDAAELHRRTGGNAFFVTECLSAGVVEIPPTVREAVLARRARLSADGRAVLDAAAVSPGRSELWFLDALVGESVGLDECIDKGVLLGDRDAVVFRHELARQAVLDAVPPGVRRALHRTALQLLAAPPSGEPDRARLVHHAEALGDTTTIFDHAPLAAEAALRAGARREALRHLELVLRHEAGLPVERRLAFWGDVARIRSELGLLDASLAAYASGIALAEESGDLNQQGLLLAESSLPLTMMGRQVDADLAIRQAVEVSEALPPGPALAYAYAQRSATAMLARELAEAEHWGQQAIELAAALGEDRTLAYAQIQSGVALLMAGDDAGLVRLEAGIELARQRHDYEMVVRGLSQIGSGGGEIRRYSDAVPALRACIDVAEEHELGRGMYAVAWLARCDFEQGRWDEAATGITRVLRSAQCAGIIEVTALAVLGRLRSRRGDPDVWGPLDRALELAQETGHLQRLWPVAAARAEAAWLAGDVRAEVPLLQQVQALAAELDYPWAREELDFWLWRAGQVDTGPTRSATPFSLQQQGRWRQARAAWAELGCPYEEATALAHSADETHLRQALAIFTRLEAGPAMRIVTEQLRAAGARVPRGPNQATKTNPKGLTDRELEVLQLLVTGASNREIAAALHISLKTTGHHVSHILTKLGARSRVQAVAIATGAGFGLEL